MKKEKVQEKKLTPEELLKKKTKYLTETLSRPAYAHGARVFYSVGGGAVLHCDIKRKVEIISAKCIIKPDFSKADPTNVYPAGNMLDIMSIRALNVFHRHYRKDEDECLPPPNRKNLRHNIIETL